MNPNLVLPCGDAVTSFSPCGMATFLGIHLMRTGEIEANIVCLNEEARLPQIPDLVARKLAGPERATLDDADVALHEAEVARLRRMLEQAGTASSLAEEPTAQEALHDLLLRIRLGRL
jgi:hypothetical protein